LVASGVQSGGTSFALGSTTNFAGYAELNAPLTHALELDGALRTDHYNSYGESTTPKISVNYTPLRQLSVHGTYGQGFRAPSPAEAGQAGSLFGTGSFPDPVLCKQTAAGVQLPGSFPVTCNSFPTGLQTTSPDLKPERSTNYTFGFIATPVDQLKLRLDYWDIKVKQDIVSASELVNLGVPAQSLQFQIVRGPPEPLQQVTAACQNNLPACPTVLTPVGLIAFQVFPYINATQTEVNGIDFELEGHADIGAAGRLGATLNYSHMLHYYLTDPLGNRTDLAGTHGPTGVSGDTGNPKDRAVLTLTWDRGPWDVAGSVNYVGHFNLTDPSIGINDCGSSILNSGKWINAYTGPNSFCEVGTFVDVDLNVEYTFSDHFRVRGAVLNLFDKPPPLDMQTYGASGNYSGAFHDAGAIGRFYSVGATYTF
jgi:iron complex outermembrane receptor protein